MRKLYSIYRYILRLVLSKEHYARKIGVKLGDNCRLIGNNNFGSEPYLVTIGNHVSITQSSFITHDGAVWIFRDKLPDIEVFKPITIGNNVFIGINCILLPGVTIGDNVIVGAGSVVTKDLDSNYVYAGIPAKKIKTIDEYNEGIRDICFHTKMISGSKKRNLLEEYFAAK